MPNIGLPEFVDEVVGHSTDGAVEDRSEKNYHTDHPQNNVQRKFIFVHFFFSTMSGQMKCRQPSAGFAISVCMYAPSSIGCLQSVQKYFSCNGFLNAHRN